MTTLHTLAAADGAAATAATGVTAYAWLLVALPALGAAVLLFGGRATGTVDGQIMAFFVMVVAAAEVVVGLAIIMSIYRTRRSASIDDANLLKY